MIHIPSQGFPIPSSAGSIWLPATVPISPGNIATLLAPLVTYAVRALPGYLQGVWMGWLKFWGKKSRKWGNPKFLG